MKTAVSPALPDRPSIPSLPDWIGKGWVETIEDQSLAAGATLAHLHLLNKHPDLPHALWRARLALAAAEVCMRLSGRPERAADLRDAVTLARPGDHPGPAGEVFGQWLRAVGRPVSVATLARALPRIDPEAIGSWLAVPSGSPVARAASVFERVLADTPRAQSAALILGDAVLARSLGWSHIVPVFAAGLTSRDFRLTDEALRAAFFRSVVAAGRTAVPMAADLARRTERLRAIAPVLRARGADRALELFLVTDALAPVDLSAIMSDRAARRLCDRLVTLGALRELTGRDSFRLYGL